MLDGLTVSEMVKTVREGKGLSQVELAQRLGVTSAYVCLVETGRRHPRVKLQDDFYWRLAGLLFEGWGNAAGRMNFYGNLVALDMYERQPEIYLMLGRHFFAELQQDLSQSFKRRQFRQRVRETAPPPGVTELKAVKK